MALNSDYVEAHNNLGLTLRDGGQRDEAVDSLRRAVALKSDFAEAHHNLGIVLGEQNSSHDEALESLRRALALEPDFAEAHSHLGIALRGRGKLDEALVSLRRAVVLSRTSPRRTITWPAYCGTATSGTRRSQVSGGPWRSSRTTRKRTATWAWRSKSGASTARPSRACGGRWRSSQNPEAHNNLGIALKNQHQLDEAAESLRRALALKPNYAEAHSNLGIVLRGTGQKHDEAVESLRRALALNPDFAEAHSNLGVALRNQDALDEALESLRRAVVLKQDYAEGYHNLGVMLGDLGQLDEAIAELRRGGGAEVGLRRGALWRGTGPAAPGRSRAGIFRLRMALALRRVRVGGPSVFAATLGRWPLDGRTILLHAEQGLRDTLQLVRYASLVAARGGRVVLECQPELVPLLRGLAWGQPGRGTRRAAARLRPAPPPPEPAPLPRHDPREHPGRSAVRARRSEPTRRRLGGVPTGRRAQDEGGGRVGRPIRTTRPNCVAGRSMSLGVLGALARVQGVQLVALQKGAPAAQAEAPPEGMGLVNLGAYACRRLRGHGGGPRAARPRSSPLTPRSPISQARWGARCGCYSASTPGSALRSRGGRRPRYPTARLFRQERQQVTGKALSRGSPRR